MVFFNEFFITSNLQPGKPSPVSQQWYGTSEKYRCKNLGMGI